MAFLVTVNVRRLGSACVLESGGVALAADFTAELMLFWIANHGLSLPGAHDFDVVAEGLWKEF